MRGFVHFIFLTCCVVSRHPAAVLWQLPCPRTLEGMRKDTMPLMNALKALGWTCEIICYDDEIAEDVFLHIIDSADAYLSRVTLGDLKGGSTRYLRMLSDLQHGGVAALPSPEAMSVFAAKDSLVKLKGVTAFADSGMVAYRSALECREKLPASAATGARIVMKRFGMDGAGTYLVAPSASESGSFDVTEQVTVGERTTTTMTPDKLGSMFDDYFATATSTPAVVDLPAPPLPDAGVVSVTFTNRTPVAVSVTAGGETVQADLSEFKVWDRRIRRARARGAWLAHDKTQKTNQSVSPSTPVTTRRIARAALLLQQ